MPEDRQTKSDSPSNTPATEETSLTARTAGRTAPGLAETPPLETGESEEVQQLRTEFEQVKDHALRAQAELENYRKRIAREMAEERRYANLRLLRDLLPVLDNVERAIAAAEKSPDPAGLLQGFKMVARQLETLLQQYQCVKIEALHQPFDPSRHQAISQQPSREHPANTVLQVVQNGYQLQDRIVRPSQVIVSAAVPEGEQAAAGPSDGKNREDKE